MAEDLFWSVLDNLKSQYPGFGGRNYKGMDQIKNIKKIDLFIDYNFKIPYKYNYR